MLNRYLWSNFKKTPVGLFPFYRLELTSTGIKRHCGNIGVKFDTIKDFLKDIEHLIKDPMIEIPYEIDFDIPDWIEREE